MGRGIVVVISFLVTISFMYCDPKKSNRIESNEQILDSLKAECIKLLNSPDLLDAAVALEKEALAQNNEEFLGFSYGYMLKYYRIYSSNEENAADSVRLYGLKARDSHIRANNQEIALRVEADILRWEVLHEDFDGAFVKIYDLIKVAEKIGTEKNLIDVYSVLGLAYMMSYSPAEALSAYHKELDAIRKLEVKEPEYILSEYVAVFTELANASMLSENFDELIAYSDSIRYYLDKYPEGVPKSNIEILADIFVVEAKIGKKEFADIGPYVNKLIAYRDMTKKEDRGQTYYNIQSSLSDYYFEKKEYQKALNSINEVVDYYATVSDHDLNESGSVERKAAILAAMGRQGEAFELQSNLLNYLNSFIKKNATRQISEIYAQHQVHILEKESIEKDARARNFQLISVFLIVVCVFMIVIVIVVRMNYDKLKLKNEKIFEQYKVLDKYRKEINSLNSSIVLQNSSDSVKELTLYEKIENFMNETQCYKDPEITREFLAIQVGTNREYLTRAIQENVNMTFTEYINNHRLEYARILLIENINLSVDNVYMSAGFTAKSTFYRLFKQKYDLTPKELRDLAIGYTD